MVVGSDEKHKNVLNLIQVASLLNGDPNSTCLSDLKQIQNELKSRTQIDCGLGKITTTQGNLLRGIDNKTMKSSALT